MNDYRSWRYPTVTNFQWASRTGSVDQPEILEADQDGMDSVCANRDGCALLVGVVSVQRAAADYRLRGFYGRDQLKVDEPFKVQAKLYTEDQTERWTYHWFIITDAVEHGADTPPFYGKPSDFFPMTQDESAIDVQWDGSQQNPDGYVLTLEQSDFIHTFYPDYKHSPYELMLWLEEKANQPDPDWAYHIAVGKDNDQGGDPNLYVALYDGRYPSLNDWDAASTKPGADAVTIASTDAIWAEKGWDASAGVIVVVGVHETEPTDYTVVLSKQPAAG
jgi:hypothetical protein